MMLIIYKLVIFCFSLKQYNSDGPRNSQRLYLIRGAHIHETIQDGLRQDRTYDWQGQWVQTSRIRTVLGKERGRAAVRQPEETPQTARGKTTFGIFFSARRTATQDN